MASASFDGTCARPINAAVRADAVRRGHRLARDLSRDGRFAAGVRARRFGPCAVLRGGAWVRRPGLAAAEFLADSSPGTVISVAAGEAHSTGSLARRVRLSAGLTTPVQVGRCRALRGPGTRVATHSAGTPRVRRDDRCRPPCRASLQFF